MPSLETIRSCCGIVELDGLSPDPIQNLRALHRKELEDRDDVSPIEFGIFVFTDNVHSGYGKNLAAYIKRNKLGVIKASKIVTNPVHFNDTRVQVWIWEPHKPRLKAWLKKNPVREEW